MDDLYKECKNCRELLSLYENEIEELKQQNIGLKHELESLKVLKDAYKSEIIRLGGVAY